jgi:hypothetical protein
MFNGAFFALGRLFQRLCQIDRRSFIGVAFQLAFAGAVLARLVDEAFDAVMEPIALVARTVRALLAVLARVSEFVRHGALTRTADALAVPRAYVATSRLRARLDGLAAFARTSAPA